MSVVTAMVSALDDGVGAVYSALEKNNMVNNSVIVFTTDNGGPANGFDYNAANNFPLRFAHAHCCLCCHQLWYPWLEKICPWTSVAYQGYSGSSTHEGCSSVTGCQTGGLFDAEETKRH